MEPRQPPNNMELSDWHSWWKRTGASKLRAIFMAEWDPIGIAEFPEAATEYDSYVGFVGRMLREGADENEIAEYLMSVRTVQMGEEYQLPDDRDLRTAKASLELASRARPS